MAGDNRLTASPPLARLSTEYSRQERSKLDSTRTDGDPLEMLKAAEKAAEAALENERRLENRIALARRQLDRLIPATKRPPANQSVASVQLESEAQFFPLDELVSAVDQSARVDRQALLVQLEQLESFLRACEAAGVRRL